MCSKLTVGFTLLEVIIAFTIAMLGISVFYLSSSNLMMHLSYKNENGQVSLSDISRLTYIGVYRDINISVVEIVKEGNLDCMKLMLDNKTVIRCPYLVKIEDNIYVPANIYQIRIEDMWYIVPRIE